MRLYVNEAELPILRDLLYGRFVTIADDLERVDHDPDLAEFSGKLVAERDVVERLLIKIGEGPYMRGEV